MKKKTKWIFTIINILLLLLSWIHNNKFNISFGLTFCYFISMFLLVWVCPIWDNKLSVNEENGKNNAK